MESNFFPVLIERQLRARRSGDSELTEVVIEIGQPYWTDPGIEAACPVAIRGTVGRVNDIHGIDPMSAMKQAIDFVEAYLSHPADELKFFWPDGEPYSDN